MSRKRACEPLDYGKEEAPSEYRCDDCGAHGVRLWREYNTFVDCQTLRCRPCAIKSKPPEDEDIEERFDSDQVAGMVPAVPTEDGETFWGYSSVPMDGVRWWYGLRCDGWREEMPERLRAEGGQG